MSNREETQRDRIKAIENGTDPEYQRVLHDLYSKHNQARHQLALRHSFQVECIEAQYQATLHEIRAELEVRSSCSRLHPLNLRWMP